MGALVGEADVFRAQGGGVLLQGVAERGVVGVPDEDHAGMFAGTGAGAADFRRAAAGFNRGDEAGGGRGYDADVGE